MRSNTSHIIVTSSITTKNIKSNTPIKNSRRTSPTMRSMKIRKIKNNWLMISNLKSKSTKSQQKKFSLTKIITSRMSIMKQITKRIITKTTMYKSTKSSSTTRKIKMSKKNITSTNKAQLNLLHKFTPKKILLPLNERAEQFLLKI